MILRIRLAEDFLMVVNNNNLGVLFSSIWKNEKQPKTNNLSTY